jgi:hypothetical protein
MSIFPTILLDAVINVPQSDAFKQFEGRGSIYDVVKAFMSNTEKLVPKAELESARVSSRRVTKIPVLNKLTSTEVIKDTRQCDPADSPVESTFVQPEYQTYSFSFHMTPHYNHENYISYQEEFAWKLLQHLYKFGEVLDADLVSFLEANKTLINASDLFGGISDGLVTVGASLKEEFYKSIPSIMYRNDLSGMQVIDIANPEAQIMYDFLNRQGASNAVNTAYQISNFAPYRSNRVVREEGVAETHFLVPDGHLGLLDWRPYEFVTGKKVHDSDYWGTIQDPIFGFNWAVRYKADCTDLSGVEGGISDLTTAFVEKFEFSIDLAPMTSYSSDTSSAIFKYDIEAPVAVNGGGGEEEV